MDHALQASLHMPFEAEKPSQKLTVEEFTKMLKILMVEADSKPKLKNLILLAECGDDEACNELYELMSIRVFGTVN